VSSWIESINWWTYFREYSQAGAKVLTNVRVCNERNFPSAVCCAPESCLLPLENDLAPAVVMRVTVQSRVS
jgi:hypothetical protein